MSKYVCLACGEVFDEDDIESWIEYHGLDYGGESWSGSPCCQEDYVDAYECDCCGEYITSDTYVEIEDKRYCENCFTINNLKDI